MDRQTIKREFPIGNNCSDGRLYDPVSGGIAITAGAAVYGAYQVKEAREEQEEAIKKTEIKAEQAQEKQEEFALEEKKKADTKLEEQRARIIRAQQGRGGLLFGSELGVDSARKTTLGA